VRSSEERRACRARSKRAPPLSASHIRADAQLLARSQLRPRPRSLQRPSSMPRNQRSRQQGLPARIRRQASSLDKIRLRERNRHLRSGVIPEHWPRRRSYASPSFLVALPHRLTAHACVHEPHPYENAEGRTENRNPRSPSHDRTTVVSASWIRRQGSFRNTGPGDCATTRPLRTRETEGGRTRNGPGLAPPPRPHATCR
jgi:hypothetical protein